MKKVYLAAIAAVFGLSSAMSFAATAPAKAPVETAAHNVVVKHHNTNAHKKMPLAKHQAATAKNKSVIK